MAFVVKRANASVGKDGGSNQSMADNAASAAPDDAEAATDAANARPSAPASG